MTTSKTADVIGGDYVKVLDGLEEIRELTCSTNDIKLPQICVVGDQSSGKSSLLSSIIGCQGLLPEGGGTVTKCPIIVQLQPCAEVKILVYGSSESDDQDNVPFADAQVQLPFADAQDQVPSAHDQVQVPSADKSTPAEYTTFNNVDDANSKIKKVQEEILKSEGIKMSKTPVRVKYFGPDVPKLVLVDLPGITHFGGAQECVTQVIREFIQDEKTLIVAVRQADGDTETQKALDLAEQVDPEKVRTLAVLTKCDNFSSEINTKRAEELLIDAVHSGSLGAHAVCCRMNGGTATTSTEEQNVIKTKFRTLVTVPNFGTHVGVESLRKRLEHLLADRIKCNIPSLELSLRDKLKNAQAELARVGKVPKSKEHLVKLLGSELRELQIHIEHSLTPLVIQFETEVRETKYAITQEWVDSNFCENVFVAPFFQGQSTFKHCSRLIQQIWSPILENLLDSIMKFLRESKSTQLLSSALPKNLLGSYLECWMNQCDYLDQSLRSKCGVALDREQHYGTLNHYLTSKFQEEVTLPEELVQEIADTIITGDIARGILRYDTVPKIKQVIQQLSEKHITKFNRSNLLEQTKIRILAAVRAHFSVEHKTFTDTVMKIVRDEVILAWQEWVITVESNTNIKSQAVEDSSVQHKRQAASSAAEITRTCLNKISDIKKILQVQVESAEAQVESAEA